MSGERMQVRRQSELLEIHRLASLQNTTALADALRDAGVATWNIKYRRLDSPGGGWPGTFQDVASAMDSLRSYARRFPLDLDRVVAVGHSAGGHLALWLAARGKIPVGHVTRGANPLIPRAAIALGGPGDLRDFMTYGQARCGDGVIDKLLGGAFDAVSERWGVASPRELLPLGVRQRLVVGIDDFIMPERARDAYVAAARASGDEADLIVIPDAGHFEVAPSTAAWPRVRNGILDLLRK